MGFLKRLLSRSEDEDENEELEMMEEKPDEREEEELDFQFDNSEETKNITEFCMNLARNLDAKAVGGREIENLTEVEKNFYLTSIFEGEVMNDGVYSFYYGYYGKFVYDLEAAFRAIGSEEGAGICKRAVEAFGTDDISLAETDRQAQMDDMEDEDLEADLKMCEDDFFRIVDDLMPLRYKYYMENQ